MDETSHERLSFAILGKLNTLKEETFSGRNFHVFAVFGLFRESFFREIFQTVASGKVYSREIRERWVIYE